MKYGQKFKGPDVIPDVSILMTVWNGEFFLAEAIESVLAQETTSTWELIVVDDGSTDRSAEVAQAFVDRDNRITLLSHPGRVNSGISASRNLAMAQARGDVLAFLDADDVWLPYRMEHQLMKWRACPQAAMIYGQAERWYDASRGFDENEPHNGSNFIPPLIPAEQHAGLINGSTLLQWILADESLTPCTCSVLVRTSVARRLGGFDASFRGLYDDQVFYAKVSLAESVFVDERCVARYRRHAGSCCWRAEKLSAANSGALGMSRRHFLSWLSTYIQKHDLPYPMGLATNMLNSPMDLVAPIG